MYTQEMKISEITPPFNFELYTGLYSSYTFPELVDVVMGNQYYRVIYTANEKMVLLVIEAEGTIDHPDLNIVTYSSSPLSESDLSYIRKKVRWMLGLDEDLSGFYRHIREHDPVLSRFIDRLYGLRAPATPTVFEAAVHALVEQQISFNFAGKIKSRLVKEYGETIEVGGKVYYGFPRPEALARTTPDDLRLLQLSRRKGEYIRDVAAKVVAGEFDFESLMSQPNEIVIEEISKLRGLGKWTAEMIMVRGMRKLDAIPADDVALRRLISHYYFNDDAVSSEDARKLAESRWGKYRGYAAFYLMYGGRVEKFLK